MYTGTMAGALGEIGLGRKQFLHAFVNTVPLRKPASLRGGSNSQAVLNGKNTAAVRSLTSQNSLKIFLRTPIKATKIRDGKEQETGLGPDELQPTCVNIVPLSLRVSLRGAWD